VTREERDLHREAVAAHALLAALWRRRWSVVVEHEEKPTLASAKAMHVIDACMLDAESRLADVEARIRTLRSSG
jgi:hypothetical protein